MQFPFTRQQFLDVFVRYNLDLWPAQMFLNLLALAALMLYFSNYRLKNRIISAILAFLFLWTGLVYHLCYFTTINKAAYLFGALFIVQGLNFLYFGMKKDGFSFEYKTDVYHWIGLGFILYGLAIYPLFGAWFGHRFPANPTFGLPCPTTIFAFGMLLLSTRRIPFFMLIIPLLWSLIGFMAALAFGIYEDTGLLVAGIAGSMMIMIRNKKIKIQ